MKITRERLTELVGYEERAAKLESERERALAELSKQQAAVLKARRAAAGPLAEACQKHLRKLAMPNAVVAIDVQGEAGEQVTFLLSANPGSAPSSGPSKTTRSGRSVQIASMFGSSKPPTRGSERASGG